MQNRPYIPPCCLVFARFKKNTWLLCHTWYIIFCNGVMRNADGILQSEHCTKTTSSFPISKGFRPDGMYASTIIVAIGFLKQMGNARYYASLSGPFPNQLKIHRSAIQKRAAAFEEFRNYLVPFIRICLDGTTNQQARGSCGPRKRLAGNATYLACWCCSSPEALLPHGRVVSALILLSTSDNTPRLVRIFLRGRFMASRTTPASAAKF